MNLKSLNFKTAAYNELLDAKEVCVKHCRRCSVCGGLIDKGERCITASRLTDKLYNKTYKYLLDSGLDPKKFSFVKKRHWVHKGCVVIKHPKKITKVIKKPNNTYKASNVEILEHLDEVPLDGKLLLLSKAYANGELIASEYQDLQDAIIHELAFRDAMMNEF